MAKESTRYVCQTCGSVYARWAGRCSTCMSWNTLVEEVVDKRASASAAVKLRGGAAKPIAEISIDHATRAQTGIGEFDRVLGGGVVLGGVTLLGGDPGVGKSTLLMQALAGLASQGHRVLYVSGEESAGQTASRARRLGAISDNFYVLAENDISVALAAIGELKPTAFVLDSVQTARAPELESAAGTVSQLREVASRVVERAKRDNVAAFLVGHVTKDGALAGPKVLEHLVDVVLAFEGERGHAFRALRVHKNRFGSATEVGVFEMTGEGMQQVPNPSELFLRERPLRASGSVVCATSEGSRPMLVEVQALVTPSAGGAGRRVSNGADSARLAMILAVLERKCGYALGTADVFVNVAGGMRVDEPATDLALALAIASSLVDKPIPPDVVAFGETGLAGEVRSVPRGTERLYEARSMGFKRAIVPSSLTNRDLKGGGEAAIEVVGAKTVQDALAAVFEG